MPPKFLFTKEEIVAAALDLVRESGTEALTARALAAKLNCSVKPIFGLFTGMEEVQAEVRTAAYRLYQNTIITAQSDGKYPPYKASGMAYICFARNEKALFKLLFMCDRSNETIPEDREAVKPLLELLEVKLGIGEDEAYLFHLEMWIYVHGIATMLATDYLNWDEEFISKVLTDAYAGMTYRYTEGKNNAGN